VKLHVIFALKYNKQQLLMLLDKINLATKYKNSNIFGETLPWTSPFINIGGTCPPCPIGINAPDNKAIFDLGIWIRNIVGMRLSCKGVLQSCQDSCFFSCGNIQRSILCQVVERLPLIALTRHMGWLNFGPNIIFK